MTIQDLMHAKLDAYFQRKLVDQDAVMEDTTICLHPVDLQIVKASIDPQFFTRDNKLQYYGLDWTLTIDLQAEQKLTMPPARKDPWTSQPLPA